MAEFLRNWKAITKYMVDNYKHGVQYMATEIKNMEKPVITIPDAPDNLSTRAEIFIWESDNK